jgi:prophage regulatory protein
MKFLRIRQVMQVTGLSRMTIYRLELAGKFPKRRQLSQNSVAWLESDIAVWAEARPVAHLRGPRSGRATIASAWLRLALASGARRTRTPQCSTGSGLFIPPTLDGGRHRQMPRRPTL